MIRAGAKKKTLKWEEIKIPLFRLLIMNQATRTALTTNRPSPANAIPTMTSFGNSDFSRASMESGSRSLNKQGGKKGKTEEKLKQNVKTRIF